MNTGTLLFIIIFLFSLKEALETIKELCNLSFQTQLLKGSPVDLLLLLDKKDFFKIRPASLLFLLFPLPHSYKDFTQPFSAIRAPSFSVSHDAPVLRSPL